MRKIWSGAIAGALLLGVALWGLHMGMTQGLLAAMVADTAPADLRGTAFGLFNLVSGVAMLLASAIAGWLWDQAGSRATFLAGAASRHCASSRWSSCPAARRAREGAADQAFGAPTTPNSTGVLT